MIVSNLVRGDCVYQLSQQQRQFDFIFADPPFNIGQDYEGFEDNKSRDEYIDFTTRWVHAVWQKCDGVLALHGNDYLAELYIMLSRTFKMPRIAWVNWHYRFGQCTRSNWIDSRCHCLIFSRNPKHTWNPEPVLVESDRVKYGDKRVDETDNGGMRLPGTVWGVPSDGPYWGRITGNNKERRKGHPNQLPEAYLDRLIRAYTNEGDWVLDPFGGSGTTAVVADALNRNCVTIDISPQNVESVRDRLKSGAVRIG